MEDKEYDQDPGLTIGLQMLSPPLRVALCSPDISGLLAESCLAELATHVPPLQGVLDKEDTFANRLLVQPVAVMPGWHDPNMTGYVCLLHPPPLPLFLSPPFRSKHLRCGGQCFRDMDWTDLADNDDGHDEQVLARLRRLRFTAEYFGITATPITLQLQAPDENDPGGCGGRGLVGGAHGTESALEFCFGSLHSDDDGAEEGYAQELQRYLHDRPLRVDVWDADSGFALGGVSVPGQARWLRQGRAAVFFFDLCPFLTPFAPEDAVTRGSSSGVSMHTAATATKQVQVAGLDKGALLAFRVICVPRDSPRTARAAQPEGSNGSILIADMTAKSGLGHVASPTRVPLKPRNGEEDSHASRSGGGAGARGGAVAQDSGRALLDAMLKLSQGAGGGHAGWHRAGPHQDVLPQRAALALVFVNQHRVLEALRAESQLRITTALAKGQDAATTGGGEPSVLGPRPETRKPAPLGPRPETRKPAPLGPRPETRKPAPLGPRPKTRKPAPGILSRLKSLNRNTNTATKRHKQPSRGTPNPEPRTPDA
jgi:hypothetical protein